MSLVLTTDSVNCDIKYPHAGYLVKSGENSECKVFVDDFYDKSEYLCDHPDIDIVIKQAEENWSLEFGMLVLKGDASYHSDVMTYKGEKYKITSWKKVYHNKTCWDKNGFDLSDFELGEELGLLTPRNAPELQDEIDFNEMIDNEENFQIDGENDIYEYELCISESIRECEVIIPEKIYENIPVRINILNDKFAIGSIDDKNNVYIPRSVINGSKNTKNANSLAEESHTNVSLSTNETFTLNKNTQIDYGKRTIGEICMMNLVYNPCGKNIWKAIYIHPKIEPFVKARLIQKTGNNMWCIEIPKQDIGKMIGKNGRCIHKIRKDILHNYPDMKKYWNKLDENHYEENGWRDDFVEKYIEDGYFPSFDINQGKDCTTVNIWSNSMKMLVRYPFESNKPTDLQYSGFCPIQGVLKKMYC